MATNEERVTAIANAIINGAATAQQKTRMGRALAYHAAQLTAYDNGTTAEKSNIAVNALKDVMLGIIRNFEGSQAVTDAAANAASAVQTDFAELA